MTTDKDYVLGTHDQEIERLGLQHRVWRPRVTDAWRRAGFTVGQTLLDIGCGPGYATIDLAEIAGREGRAIGIDRSRRFLDAGAAAARARGLANIEWLEQDLDEQDLPALQADGAWSRWVYAFVRDPRALLARWLEELGFEVRELRPWVAVARPNDFVAQWPDAFVDVGVQRLVDLGRVDAARAEAIRDAYRESQSTPGAFQLTPTVLEIIATKR